MKKIPIKAWTLLMPLLSFILPYQATSQYVLELTDTLAGVEEYNACVISSNQVLGEESASVYNASVEIIMKPGFHAMEGANFFASIGGVCALAVSYSKLDETHIRPGSIQLSAYGGTPPYSYLWGTGETTDSLQGLTAGIYTVTVTDSTGQTATESIEILFKDTYDAVWQDIPARMIYTGTSYLKPYTDPEETLLGCNLLDPNTDGLVEFTLLEDLGQEEWFYVGFIEDGVDPYNSIAADYLIRVLNDTVRAYEKGIVKLGQASTGAAGDILTVSRSGTLLTYSVNGSVFDSTVVDPAKALRPVLFLLRSNQQGRLDVDVETDFACPVLQIRYLTTDAIYPSGNGKIDLIPEGGIPPYTYSWSNGATLEDLGNIPSGEYHVTVTDVNGQTATAVVDLFQTVNAVWRPLPVGLAIQGGNSYYKTHMANGVSSQTALGCFEFNPTGVAKVSAKVLGTLGGNDGFQFGFRDTSKVGSNNDQYGYYGFRVLTNNPFGMQLLANTSSYGAGVNGLSADDMAFNKFMGFEFSLVLKDHEVIYYKNQKELMRDSLPAGIQLVRADAYFEGTDPSIGTNLEFRTSFGESGMVGCGDVGCDAFLPDSISAGTTTTLFMGDIMFASFQDGGGPDSADRVTLKINKALSPGTSFTIANTVFEAGELPFVECGNWYSGRGLDSSDIASQRITYTGPGILPAGSFLTFDLPTNGKGNSLFANNFSFGNSTPDICMTNNGNTANPLLDISTTVPTAMYILQGDWAFKPEYARFNGRVIAAFQTVEPFFTIADTVTPFTGISRLFPNLECTSTEELPSVLTLVANEGNSVAQVESEAKVDRGHASTPLPGGGGIVAFPNPFSDGFTLQLELMTPQSVSVRLFNTVGQTATEPIDIDLGIGTHTLPIGLKGHAGSGMYLLHVRTKDGNVIKRMVRE